MNGKLCTCIAYCSMYCHEIMIHESRTLQQRKILHIIYNLCDVNEDVLLALRESVQRQLITQSQLGSGKLLPIAYPMDIYSRVSLIIGKTTPLDLWNWHACCLLRTCGPSVIGPLPTCVTVSFSFGSTCNFRGA